MEHVQKIQVELDKLALHFPELCKVCEKYKVPPGWVLGGVGTVLSLGILIFQGYNILCALLTTVYPIL
jgi:hypothetical protein